MRYVAIKSPEQQAALALHRTRDLFVKQRTQLVNMIRGLLAEFGIEIRRGITQALSLAERIAAGDMPDIPPLAAKMIAGLAGQVLDLQARLREIERELLAWHRSNDIARRLATIPGVGTVCATALAASVTDPHQFRSGRQFAAWLGLTPLQHSSGGKERLGRISKMGDKYLRRLLVVGMTSLVRRAKYKPEAVDPLACRSAVAKAGPSGHRRARQQGGAGDLGDHGARRRFTARLNRPAQRRLGSIA